VNIEVHPQDVSFQSSAKADSGLEIHHVPQERTAWGRRRSTHNKVNKVVQHVGTDAQLQGVLRALHRVLVVAMVLVSLGHRCRAGRRARGGRAHQSAEEEVQGYEEGN
ncbi:hypothetical protein LINGRAHAP2_LOCUS3518, partial [Linum grandiflorum]